MVIVERHHWRGLGVSGTQGRLLVALARSLTQLTLFLVTLYARARVRASREVTTTCVRCVRSACVSAGASKNWTPLATYQTTL